jgi:hypothetical protein
MVGQSVRFFAAPSKKVKKDDADSSKKGTSKKHKDGGEEQAEIDAIYKFITATEEAKEYVRHRFAVARNSASLSTRANCCFSPVLTEQQVPRGVF